MLTNWEIADTPGSYAPVKTWAGTTLDLHLVMREQLPATAYIEMWVESDGGLTLPVSTTRTLPCSKILTRAA